MALEDKLRLPASRVPFVDIIIVNWNSGSHLSSCLEHIRRTAGQGFCVDKIVVVDNASTDSSITNLACNDCRLAILRNTRNMGFAAACNQGAKQSRADYLLFLNPDIFLREDTLPLLVGFLSAFANQHIAICGPRIVDLDGTTMMTCARFPKARDFFAKALGLDRLMPRIFRPALMNEWGHDRDRIVDQVIGACMLMRRNVFQQLGGFDERYFVYYEEVDLCLRCKRSGCNVSFVSETSAVHLGGGCSNQVPGKRLFYSLRSRILYGLKHFSAPSATILCLLTIFIEPLSRVALAVGHGSGAELRDTIEGYWLFWRSTPSLVQDSRQRAQRLVTEAVQMGPTAF
jgi:N-acetylglucosaminyl-diphospho-decaprenol L-rhamnosyltransferase